MRKSKMDNIAIVLLCIGIYGIPVFTLSLLIYYMRWWALILPLVYVGVKHSISRVLDKSLLKDTER